MTVANLGVAVWAGAWTVLALVIAYRRRNGDRLAAAGWMIIIAAFLAVQEDPGLLAWMATATWVQDRDGVRGLVHPHTIGHMYGGAAMAAAGLVTCCWVARTALRRGERWAWNALLLFLVVGGGVDLVEMLLIYPHGFPLGVTPADGVRGFGWAQLVAWMLIWAFALAYSRPQLSGAETARRDARRRAS